jgi:hypothetical protein
MTYEYAVYYKLLLLCGYTDELYNFIDQALIEQDPISPVVLDLSSAGTDKNKLLSVLNAYLLDVNDSDIDYNGTVLRLILAFLNRKYAQEAMPMAELTKLMCHIVDYTDRVYGDPWRTMFELGILFDEAESGYICKESYLRQFHAFLNDGASIFT